MSSNRKGPGRLAAVFAAASCAVVGLTVIATPAFATDPPIATVTSLSVVKGSTEGGTNLIITGTNFLSVSETVEAGVSAIKFGAAYAETYLVLSNTQIAVKSPSATDASPAAGTGLVDVTVKNNNGSFSAAAAGSKFAFRAPLNAGVTENTLLNPVAGSTLNVAITGYTLGESTAFAAEKVTATVGGAAAIVTYSSTTSVNVAIPAGTPSATAVSVALFHDGVAGTPDAANAKYAAVITSLSKTSSKLAGLSGTVDAPAFTIAGKGLLGATAFKMGETSLTCTVTTDVLVKCNSIPSSEVIGPVVVNFTTNTGPRGTTAGAVFTYTDIN